MKIRIIKAKNNDVWYKPSIGKIFTVKHSINESYYQLEDDGDYIFKEDAEVVEEEKSCDNCLYRDIYCLKRKECNDLESWKPLNTVDHIQWVETADASKIVSGREQQNKIVGVGTDAPTIINEKGGKQSKLIYGFDAIDAKAMFALAKVMQEGREKYGYDENWRHITPNDHYNHLMTHINAWKAGDTQDEHLAHAFCRAMMLYATAEEDNGQV